MIRLALTVSADRAEVVLAELLELAPSGVQETELSDGSIEFAVYGSEGELPALGDVKVAAAGALIDLHSSVIPDDWDERWKQFHKPVFVEAPAGMAVAGLRVRAPWQAPLASVDAKDRAGTSRSGGPFGEDCGDACRPSGRQDGAARSGGPLSEDRGGGLGECPKLEPRAQEIVIDPGRAFGTGAHASTQLCLQLLLELASASGRLPLLDVGTGSGVLAIAASKLGFDPVLAVDHDVHSVEAAAANAKVNGVSIEVRRADLRDGPLPIVNDGVIVANLLRPLLIELATGLDSTAPAHVPAHLIASGLLREEVDEVSALFAAERIGLAERMRVHSGEWAAVWLRWAVRDQRRRVSK